MHRACRCTGDRPRFWCGLSSSTFLLQARISLETSSEIRTRITEDSGPFSFSPGRGVTVELTTALCSGIPIMDDDWPFRRISRPIVACHLQLTVESGHSDTGRPQSELCSSNIIVSFPCGRCWYTSTTSVTRISRAGEWLHRVMIKSFYSLSWVSCFEINNQHRTPCFVFIRNIHW